MNRPQAPFGSRLHGSIHTLKKGYGFIRCDEDGHSYFFLYDALDSFGPKFDELGQGQHVAFTSIEATKGPRAIEVKVDD